MSIRTLAAACGAALFVQFAVSPTVFAADAPAHWVTAWATALQPIPQRADLPPLYRAPEVAGRTVRQIVYPTLSARSARVHLSNQYGKTPLVIEDLRIARSTGGAAAAGNGDARVTFGGRSAISIPPGGELESDPVAIDIAEGAPYAVSAFMGPEQRIVAWHRVSNQVNYVSAPGNHAADASADAFRGRFTQYVWVTGLSVEAAPASAAVAAIGDSITDGMRSSLNQNRRWPDALARRFAAAGERSTAIVNLGISGNRLLSDSPCYGDALATRFEHDVLKRPGVKAAILLIGINDINFAAMPPRGGLDCDFPHTTVTAADLIAGYQRVIVTARHAGVKVFGATLTPASLPPQRESIRLAVNQWIRTSHAFDGVVDFDAALRDPAQPDRLRRSFDSGDDIHPSDAGYAAMAGAVPVDAVVKSTRN
ncbi:GDSL-like Lipase/Acylhydrolase family protein [Paraburkholderia xenovorans LB400]|uniref:Lipase/acylhydrolase n=1 Tax=Paraburkholderia xenovorans (strain LB400) TaxID=266265 RepID=Q13TF3_PARXL|nr:SGNH/GDSL hydrolase family protein [Paraburkholderia xenovorans]ABE32636.1 Lipase/acylhydrolase [Paraburkholderia xenovorans LB400]AIP29616.1 GDSL-like Lipase/Acylhydrolase family protein [Paraburkholderia xenovorans LB400]